MFNELIRLWKRVVYGRRADSNSYIKWLRKKGVKIGENCTFHDPFTSAIDVTQSCLIEIGNNVEFTRGTSVLCHDLAWAVFKNINGEIIGSNKKTTIGNNVFIGYNTTILRGVHVGNNVVIGAGSIVTKDIPDNCVVAGNPAKVIMPLEDYYNKRKSSYVEEAKELAQEYYIKNHRRPDKEIFRDFFPIFTSTVASDLSNLSAGMQRVLNRGGKRVLY